ncbi:MAG: urease accessory protein UreD [Candidatus Lustribacter sp.]
MRTAGSIALTCDSDDGRTRLRAIRCEGLSRSSRAFAAPAGAVRVVLSTLGPGVLAGDRFSLDGRLAERASLIACGQMATPVFAGAAPSQTDAGWQVADGATLIVAGEPLLLEAGSAHAAEATFAVGGSGCAIIVDTFGLRGTARLSMRTRAELDGRLVYRDAYDVSGDLAGAFGTVTLIAADARRRAAFAARAEALGSPAVRIGAGETTAAVVVRLHGARVWDVRATAFEIAGVLARSA